MRLSILMAGPALALALALALPSCGWARAELVNLGDAACNLDLGLRLTLNVGDGGLRSALELSGRELASVRLVPRDVVRWGVPIVTVVTELTKARTDRLTMSRDNVTVR
jgi:hypothetical protein